MERTKMTGLYCKNPRGGVLPRENDQTRLWVTLILAATFLLLLPPHLIQAKSNYYYIHVSSYRAKSHAVRAAEDFKRKGYSTVVRGEEIPKMGYWYRLYLGPFSSYKEAKIRSDELKQRGLAKYTAIYQKDSLIQGDMAKAPTTVAPVPPPTQRTAPPVTRKPVPVQPQKEAVAPAAKAPPPVSPAPAMKPPPPVSPAPAPAKPAPKVKAAREVEPLWQWGEKGRNLPAGKYSLGWQHTYREVYTKVTKRKEITTNGGTTKTDISLSGNEKYRFDTKMNLDMLRLNFGITDSFGFFADAGVCYDDLDNRDNINFVYGGGARLNLFEVKSGTMRGFYSALQGEYHKGKLENDYQSSGGNRFSKDADWWEFVGKGEVGFARDRFALYLGATYFYYREDTDRKQLENILPPYTSVEYKDDLEQENSLGVYGGFSLNLTQDLLINVEGQLLTQGSIAAMVEYRF
jgi:hypothetical protein